MTERNSLDTSSGPIDVSEMPEVVTLTEAARYLRVHVRTLSRLLRNGTLPAVKVGRIWRIEREAVVNYLRRTNPPTPKESLSADLY